MQHPLDECLPAKARIDRHDQYQVHIGQDFLQAGRRRSRIEGYPGLAAQFFDLLDRPVQVRASFHMDRQAVGSSVAEIGQVAFWRFDHQVYIQRQACCPAHGLDDNRADGHIGYEMAVHHVYVNIIGAGGFRLGYLLAQAPKICRQDGWCNLDLASSHKPLPVRSKAKPYYEP